MGVTRNSIFDAPLPRPSLADGVFLYRNWHFDCADLWSCETECSVLLMRDSFPEQVDLAIEVCAFGAGGTTPKRLVVESPGNVTVEVELVAPHNRVLMVRSPVFSGPTAEIVFRLNRLESPFMLGMSNDDRLLGLQIPSVHRMTSERSFPLNFSNDTVCATFLMDNWAQPEPTGVWSTDNTATLVLPQFLRTADPVLSFDFWYLPRPIGVPPLIIAVECNNQIVEEWICGPDASGPWLCPVNAIWHPGETLRIALHSKNLTSPADLSINLDQRKLGIFLKTINLLKRP